MVKIRHFLPESSDVASLKLQLIQSGVLDRTNEIIYRMAPGAVDPAILKCGSSSLSYHRYTRSALLLLREDELSQIKPDCLNDKRLRIYPIWKPHGYVKQVENVPTSSTNSANGFISLIDKNQSLDGNRKQFTIMPAFASRYLGGNTSFENSFTSNSVHPKFLPQKKEERDDSFGVGGSRMIFDNFLTSRPSVWSRNHDSFDDGGSFFMSNNNMNNNLMNHLKINNGKKNEDHVQQRYHSEIPPKHHHRQGPSGENRYNDEPEWMNCGPTSRLDIIELRGFDSEDDTEGSSNHKVRKDENKNEKAEVSATTTATSGESPPPARSTPTKRGIISGTNGVLPKATTASIANDNHSDKLNNDDAKLDFDFDFLTDESMTSILGQEKSIEKNSKGHIWFADEEHGNKENNDSKQASASLMEFIMKGKQSRPLDSNNNIHSTSNTGRFMNVNDIEAKILTTENKKGLNPAAAPFIKKDPRNSFFNTSKSDQTEIFNKLITQITSNNHAASALAANLNILKTIQQQQQVANRAVHTNAQVIQSDLLKTPEAQILLQGMASGQLSYQSLVQQMNQPNKRSTDIISAVLNFANTMSGRTQLANMQLAHHLTNNNHNITNRAMHNPNMSHQMNQNHYFNRRIVGFENNNHSTHSGGIQTASQHFGVENPGNTGFQKKIPSPMELQKLTENIMYTAMIRKCQQDAFKNQLKHNDNNRGNFDMFVAGQQQPHSGIPLLQNHADGKHFKRQGTGNPFMMAPGVPPNYHNDRNFQMMQQHRGNANFHNHQLQQPNFMGRPILKNPIAPHTMQVGAAKGTTDTK